MKTEGSAAVLGGAVAKQPPNRAGLPAGCLQDADATVRPSGILDRIIHELRCGLTLRRVGSMLSSPPRRASPKGR